MSKITKTDLVREEIEKYLKELGEGVKVRQTDLTKYLKTHSNIAVTDGIIRGIFNRMDGIGGSYIEIPNVKIYKEDGKVYYYYEEYNLNFEPNSVMGKFKEATIEFENLLKDKGLWNISVLDIPFEQRRSFFNYMDKLEELRNIVGI